MDFANAAHEITRWVPAHVWEIGTSTVVTAVLGCVAYSKRKESKAERARAESFRADHEAFTQRLAKLDR